MIIFSPTKTMKETTIQQEITYSDKTTNLAKEIASLDKEQLSKKLKVKNKTLDVTYNYYQEFGNNCTKAYLTYDGVSFKQLVSSNETYIESNVYIISALYGLINGCDVISKYRLDMSYPGLYKYWGEEVNNKVETLKHNEILNLASNEFSKIIKTNKKIYNVKFIREAKVSTYETKLLRGHILNYCVENNITNYTNLVKMKTDLIKDVNLINDTFNITIH